MKDHRGKGSLSTAFFSMVFFTRSARSAPKAGCVSDPPSGYHGSVRRTSIDIPVFGPPSPEIP